jgi:hypothetical protein
MKNVDFIFCNFGNVLATRDQGKRVAEALGEWSTEPVNFILDFDGVDVVAPPFLDEVLSELYRTLRRHRDEGVLAIAVQLDEDNLETLKMVLEAGDWPGLAFARADKVDLLTKSPHLEDTLREAQQLGPFTAPQLANEMGLKLPNMNQRLAQLVGAGALARRRDEEAERGKRWSYVPASPEVVEDLLRDALVITP